MGALLQVKRSSPLAVVLAQPEAPRVNYRGRGALKGQLVIGPEFFKLLSDEEYGIGSESGSA